MKKITFLLVMLLMTVLATNNVFAQNDDDAFLKIFNGEWDFQKAEIDKSNKTSTEKTAKVKNTLETTYKDASVQFFVDKKRFLASISGGKRISGTFVMEGDNIILTNQEDGSIFLRGRIYDFNEGKNMGISYTEKGVKVTLLFKKF